MKKIIPLLLFTSLLFSCNSKSNHNNTIVNNVNDTDVSYKDNSINIPIGYTYQTIQEYVPKDRYS